MPLLVFLIVASLLAGCVSSTRMREAHCLGTLMMDLSQSFDAMHAIEDRWRATQQASANDAVASNAERIDGQGPAFLRTGLRPTGGLTPSRNYGERDEVYRQLTRARRLHQDNLRWFDRVSRRVQTRMEEDEMLYGVLGMGVSAPAVLLFYPLIRYHVRSALWDETDPDAETDPIQQFCLARLDASGLGSESP